MRTTFEESVSRISASCHPQRRQEEPRSNLHNIPRLSATNFIPHYYTHPSLNAIRTDYSNNNLMNQRRQPTALSSSSTGECSTTNWVRLLRSKRASYPDLYHIWPYGN